MPNYTAKGGNKAAQHMLQLLDCDSIIFGAHSLVCQMRASALRLMFQVVAFFHIRKLAIL